MGKTPNSDWGCAITSKSLKVTFSAPVVDTTKAVLNVKRDGIKSNVSAITWNADKTEATIELTSKISAAVYTVDVTGLGDTVLTGSVTAENEKVGKIEVLSTEVPLTDVDSDLSVTDLAVPYMVTNQYGENITKTTSIIASNGVVDAAKGVINFVGNYDTVINKTVAFTLINVDSNVSTTGVVTAVSAAKESSIEIKGIYNKDGKTLTETSDLSKDKFFIEIGVKDQYGNVIVSPSAASLILSESNNTIADLDDSVTAGQPVLDTTTVDGKILIAIKAPVAGLKAGATTVTLISKNTGKSATTVVNVAEGIRANNVTLGQPELVAAGESALIPITVLDKEGNQITDLDTLNNPIRGISLNGNTLVLKDGIVYLKVLAPNVGPNVAMVTVIPTQKIVTVNYTVKAAAVPTVIAGLDTKIQKSINTGLTQDITGADLIVEDQYGRTMSDTDVNSWLNLAGNSIILTSSKETPDHSPFAVNLGGITTDEDTQVIASTADTFTITAMPDAASMTNTEKMTFALSNNGTTAIASTSKDVVFTKVNLVDFASYEVVAPNSIFNENLSDFSFKVYGVKADGSKTLLKDNQYNLILPTGFTIKGLPAVNSNTLEMTAVDGTINNISTDTIPLSKDVTFKVVIGDDAATTVNKVVTVSSEARKAASFGLTSDNTSTGDVLTSLTYEASTTVNDGAIFDLSDTTATTGTLDIAALEQNLYSVDQYGLETAVVPDDTFLTFSNLVDANNVLPAATAAINDNGSTTASVTNLEAGDTVKVNIKTGALAGQTLTVTIK